MNLGVDRVAAIGFEAPFPEPSAISGEAPAVRRRCECAIATTPPATLVLIGGETSHAILTRLAAGAIAVHGRIAPLVARGTLLRGIAAGVTLVTKGGSGGEPEVIAALVRDGDEHAVRGAEGKA